MKELSEVLQDWEAVIGLEIHTELTALDTKMFCNCKLSHDDEPNANVCPVCLGLPGALPVPNKRAIESIVKAGLATNCEVQRHSMFYRKHYFYPDMAKNFQTTQGPVAFAMYGHLDLDVTGRGAAERPDCAFGEAEAQSLASASANAEGLSTSMTSTMREGNQRSGHLPAMMRPTCRCPSAARTVLTRCPFASCASTWRRTPPRWSTWAVPRAALPPLPSRSSTTTAAARL